MSMTEEQLWDMSDEDLQKLAQEAEAEEQSPDTAIEENMEQPDYQDSSDDLEEDQNNGDEIEEDEESEPEEDESDLDLSDEDDNGQPEPEVSEDDEATTLNNTGSSLANSSKPQTYKFKANGKEFEFTDDEMKSQFGKVFGQAMNYTQKMQALAPYRKMISALEDEQINEQDLNLAIDALKGNKDAIVKMVKQANLDVLDIDTEDESGYVPNSYGRDDAELRIRDVVDEISSDPEFAVTQHVVSEQWDNQSREVFSENPELIKELHIDVASGVFDKVSPMATKLKVMDGAKRPDIEYYIEAGRQYHMQARSAEIDQFAEQQRARTQESNRISQVEQQQQQRQSAKQVSKKRKAAAPTASRSGQKTATDYLDDSDEAFEEWYKKLQESM